MKTRLTIAVAFSIVAIASSTACGTRSMTVVKNEASARVSIESINKAMVQYRSQGDRYASTLDELKDLLEPALVGGETNGYRFSVKGSADTYSVTAIPIEPGSSGERSFYSDQTGVLRYNSGAGVATAESPELH